MGCFVLSFSSFKSKELQNGHLFGIIHLFLEIV